MAAPGWNRPESPFHRGELAVQERLGVRDRMDRQGRRIIRDYLTEQHQQFFTQLSYVIAGTVDPEGRPWASVLVGKPGFLSVTDAHHLRVSATLLPGDPLAQNLADGADIGLLGIELNTRRRNRLNGVVRSLSAPAPSEQLETIEPALNAHHFDVEVQQSFGNCPQYIQARTFDWVDSESSVSGESAVSGEPESGKRVYTFTALSASERDWIATADTFFIATVYLSDSEGAASGVDVSHRGGKPGFVRVDADGMLTVPDFSGNLHFNTLGNLELNPSAGLLFIDFVQGDLLYLTGTASVVWEGPEVEAFEGAERLLRFQLEQGYRIDASLPLRWSDPEFSPFLDRTGAWS